MTLVADQSLPCFISFEDLPFFCYRNNELLPGHSSTTFIEEFDGIVRRGINAKHLLASKSFTMPG